MQRIPFNDKWKFKKQGDSHEFSLHWEEIVLPHDAVISEPRDEKQFNGTKKAFFPNGAWEYVKVFNAPESWQGKDVFLEFEGVQNHAIVYVNGSCVGSHAYGYTEFTLSIAKYLRFGEKNVVKVVCKTGDDSRWYTGGGIYRNVNLLVAETFHIVNNGLRIATEYANEKNARLRIAVKLSENKSVEVRLQIFRAEEKIVEKTVKTNEDDTYMLDVCEPQLWSAETPELYRCRAELLCGGTVSDVAEERFGIRTMTVSAKDGLKINGKQVHLRGACIHHDNGIIGVRTFRDAEYRRIRILKEAGFNAIRSAHHPASRYLLEACDELGMYVMDEAFDMWQMPKSCDDYANEFDANWHDDIRAMVEKDHNHPCVILYSIGNEISDLAGAAGVTLAKDISRAVKSLDPYRYTTVAINGLLLLMQKKEMMTLLTGEEQERKQDINEAMSSLDDVMVRINNTPSMDYAIKGGCDAVDIAGYNYMHNRYEPDIEKYPDRVIVGSETYAKYIAEMWEHICTHDNVIGDFTWTGWDYLGETGIGNVSYESYDYHKGFYGEYPYITANCGDIDITGFRTPQSYYREIVFGLRKQPYIAVHNPAMAGKTEYCSAWGWGDVVSSWSYPGYDGTPLSVDVYGKGTVELYLNGRLFGSSDCGKEYRTTFTVPYEAGVLEAVIRSEGQEYRYTLQSAGQECIVKLSAENAPIRGGLAFINIELTDKSGNIHFAEDRSVSLEVTGGKLLGFGSGAPKTTEKFSDNIHMTYRGRAFAVILAEAPKVVVRAQAESTGLEELILNVKEENEI